MPPSSNGTSAITTPNSVSGDRGSNNIEARLKPLPSTSFEYLEPEDLSNKAPRLRIHWDANVLKITGTELVARLDAGTPRIVIDGGIGPPSGDDGRVPSRSCLT